MHSLCTPRSKSLLFLVRPECRPLSCTASLSLLAKGLDSTRSFGVCYSYFNYIVIITPCFHSILLARTYHLKSSQGIIAQCTGQKDLVFVSEKQNVNESTFEKIEINRVIFNIAISKTEPV